MNEIHNRWNFILFYFWDFYYNNNIWLDVDWLAGYLTGNISEFIQVVNSNKKISSVVASFFALEKRRLFFQLFQTLLSFLGLLQ